MNSKKKGDIGVIKTIERFVSMGISVSIPFGDNDRYDLIAEFNGKLNRIQVKFCNQKEQNGSITCPCSSSLNHTTNKVKTTYENDVDYFVFYIVKWDILLLVPISEIKNKRSIKFRKRCPKNNMKHVHFIDDFTFEKTLCVETLHSEPKS